MKIRIQPNEKKKYRVLLFVTVFAMTLNLQKTFSQHVEKRQASCYEVSFSANYLKYKLQYSTAASDSVSDIKLHNKVGYGLGLFKNFEIVDGTIIRTGIQAQLHKNSAVYKLYEGNHRVNMSTISFSVPVSLIYLFNNNNKKPVTVKPYVLVGARYSAVSGVLNSDKKNIYFQPDDVMADFGLGMHLYSKKKHLVALEFLFSNGFLNVKEKSDENIYNKSVNKLFRQTFMFSLNLS